MVSECLLVRSGSTEIALHTVSVDGLLEATSCCLGVVVAVSLERIDKRVGGVIGLVEFIGLDICSLLKSFSCFNIFIAPWLATTR